MRAARPAVRTFLAGNVRRLSSFSIINRQLIRGLRQRGHRLTVFPSDDPAAPRANPSPPDVYIFNSYPWDARSAPGRLNVFVLNYEYLAPGRDLCALVARLNAAFDLVVVPSAFEQPVLASAGLTVPIEVVPWGCDRSEFHPRARPVALPTGKRFVFLYVGAVNERKGIDVLLEAYLSEFSAADDVALVIKEAPRHRSWDRWLAQLRRRYLGSGRRAARQQAEVQWLHGETPSVAGYFAAADVGVFPHRGEGFGLPILECIASGRPVIVTAGTGPASFCNRHNGWAIRSAPVCRGGRVELEPDVVHLRALLRAAYRRGPVSAQRREAVSASVRHLTWERSVAALDGVIRRHLRTSWKPTSASAAAHAQVRPHGVERRRWAVSAAARPRLTYAFYARGPESWKKVCTEIDRALGARFEDYRAFTSPDRFDERVADVVVGQSEHCLEVLLKARRINPRATVVVHQECTVLGDHVAIVNRERRRCGLAPIATTPIDFWRNRTENALADHFLVASSVARGFYLANGFDPARVHVVPFGMHRGPFRFRRQARTTRFLFLGTDPFRKGVRPLLAAWDRAALRDAELICFVDPEVLQSKRLLCYLVRNPNITVHPLQGHRAFVAQYATVDCQVLPSLEDSFSLAVADGMGVGKPAIVSTATGIQDLIVHGVNGHVVPAGDIERLAESLRQFAADRHRLRAMAEAAHETARQFTWQRFRTAVGELVASIAAGRG